MSEQIKQQVIALGRLGWSLRRIARSGNVSRARLSQILGLRNLAPAIQEKLLWLPNTTRGADRITEKSLRRIALVGDWEEQEKRFAGLLSGKTVMGK